jgi:hypothetical protein
MVFLSPTCIRYLFHLGRDLGLGGAGFLHENSPAISLGSDSAKSARTSGCLARVLLLAAQTTKPLPCFGKTDMAARFHTARMLAYTICAEPQNSGSHRSAQGKLPENFGCRGTRGGCPHGNVNPSSSLLSLRSLKRPNGERPAADVRRRK